MVKSGLICFNVLSKLIGKGETLWNWNDLSEFFKYPPEIRKAIYTTNAVESLNFSLRKVIKNKLIFVNDDDIFKIRELLKTRFPNIFLLCSSMKHFVCPTDT